MSPLTRLYLKLAINNIQLIRGYGAPSLFPECGPLTPSAAPRGKGPAHRRQFALLLPTADAGRQGPALTGDPPGRRDAYFSRADIPPFGDIVSAASECLKPPLRQLPGRSRK